MSKETKIVPIEQRVIPFYDDEIVIVQAKDGTVYVPMRPICERLGVQWAAQSKRINRDLVLSKVVVTLSVSVMDTDIKKGSRRPKTSEMLGLPLKYLNGWLFGINPSRVKEESVRDALVRYQLECYDVLAEAFGRNGVAIRHDDELMQSDDPLAIAFRNSLANARLARETYYLTKRVEDHEQRIGMLEAQLNNTGAFVTQEQAQLISEGVKTVAGVLSKRSGKNEYGGTYVELYRRFGVTSYKHIPANRFDECMNWLRNWWQTLTDETDLPF